MSKRIIFDQNMNNKLLNPLRDAGYHVNTAASQGWADISNGALMPAAENAGYDIIITFDTDFEKYYKEDGHPKQGRLACLLLSGPPARAVEFVDLVINALQSVQPGQLDQTVSWKEAPE